MARGADVSNELEKLSFSAPVTHVYNPLRYAAKPHRAYLRKYGAVRRDRAARHESGPFGMTQTGVPFGEVAHVRDFLGIEEPVDQPEREHPQGRSKVSRARAAR